MAIMSEHWVISLECGHLVRIWKPVENEEPAPHLGASIPCVVCGPEPVERRIVAITVTHVELVPSTRSLRPPPPAPPRRKLRGWRQARLPIAEELRLYA